MFIPKVEQLPNKLVPAQLLTVSPEVKAVLEDVDKLYEMPTEQLNKLQLPIARSFAYAVERGVKDGDIWDGPIVNDNPQSENALVFLMYGDLVPDENWNGEDPLPQGWYIGAIVEGSGDNGLAYSMYAESFGVKWYILTTDPNTNGKLLASQELVNALANAQIGEVLENNGQLFDGLKMDLGTLATEGFAFDENGEVIGDGVFTLKLAVPVEGGFRLMTLDSFDKNLWTLTDSAFSVLVNDELELTTNG